MAFTMADFQRLAESPLKKGIYAGLREDSWLMDVLQFETTGTLGMKMNRYKTLPTVSVRAVGEAYGDSKGVTEPLEEKLCLLGGKIDIPKEYVEAKDQIEDQRALQRRMFAKSMAYKFNELVVLGNPLTDPDEMAGIWYRLKNDLSSGQTVLGAGLDISPDSGITTANMNLFIDQVDEAIELVDGKTCDVILCNRNFRLRLISIIRQLGLFATTKDNYGRKIVTYGDGGPAIIDVGVKADQTTNIITNVHSDDGNTLTGGDATQAFFLKLGDGYVKAWQRTGMEAIDVGILEAQTHYRDVIDWGVGLYLQNARAMSRLVGIVAA